MESKRISVSKTELPPCCVRIHPLDNSVLFLGTYKLEDSGKRHGSVDVMRLDQNDKLDVISRHPTASAVLDIKISPFDPSLLVTGHSTGNIKVWRYEGESGLREVHDAPVFDTGVLITSVFFSPHDQDTVFVSLTTGESALVNLQTFTATVFDEQHDLECWTGTFGESGADSHVVYSGGDDGKLIAHDTRSQEKIWATTRRQHDAGVVSVLSSGPNWNSANPNHLWTGSYDDNVRIFDIRVADSQLIPGMPPRTVQQENLGGGVWRLIPSPIPGDNRVLTCCMYDGARILDTKGDDNLEVLSYFKKDHSSICYGGDWSSSGDKVVTCSFYDNVVQVWSPNEVEAS